MPLLRDTPAGGILQEDGGVDSAGWALKGRDVGRGRKRGRRGNDLLRRGLVSYRRDRCVMQWVDSTMRLTQRGQGVSVNFAGSYCGGAHGKAFRLCVFWISMETWIGWSGIGLMIEGKEWVMPTSEQ